MAFNSQDADMRLDAKRDSLMRTIERGGAVRWSADDRAFLLFADSVLSTSAEGSPGDEQGLDEDRDENSDEDADDVDDADESDDAAEQREADEQYIPDDILNDPRPREDR